MISVQMFSGWSHVSKTTLRQQHAQMLPISNVLSKTVAHHCLQKEKQRGACSTTWPKAFHQWVMLV